MCNTCRIAHKTYDQINQLLFEKYVQHDAINYKIYKDTVANLEFDEQAREALLRYGVATEAEYKKYVESREPQLTIYLEAVKLCKDG